MDLNLTGKIALVTGATSGVGSEVALSLAAEGANVAVNYRSSAEEADALVKDIVATGGNAKAYQADVADFAAVQAMVEAVVKDFGGLNILINNAGLAIRQRFMETKPDDWHRQIDACLYGAIHCCYAAAPHLDGGKNGRIVSVIGDSSRVGESGLAIVAAARAGVIALMKSLAREFGRSGTTANTVSLGLVETPHDKEWVDANREKLVKLYPLRRLGLPETWRRWSRCWLRRTAAGSPARCSASAAATAWFEASDAAHQSDRADPGSFAPARRRARRQGRLSRRANIRDLRRPPGAHRQARRPYCRPRHRAGRHGCDHAAEFGAVGGKLSRHRPRRRRQCADQLSLHRNRNRLSAHRRQLQSGDHGWRARRSVRAAASVRAQFENADRR